MIVCVCKALSSREIEHWIQAGARTLEDLARHTGAGTECRACEEMLLEMLEAHRRAEPANDPSSGQRRTP